MYVYIRMNKNQFLFSTSACVYMLSVYYIKRTQLCMCRVEFLLEHTTVSPAEMSLNADTFLWTSRIPPILEEHQTIITETRREVEDALRVRMYMYVGTLLIRVLIKG